MGSCLSVIINACNEVFLSAIPSLQPSTTVQPPSGSMGSTSSSPGNASQPLVGCGKFDVFINHRGIDVKTSLASTIYNTLDLLRVRAFLDRDELEAGEESWDAIKKAISDALVHIAIFSPNYAQSPWCLDELVLMLQSGKKIIPIFYHVEPSHLRWVAEGKEGAYSPAFSKHEEKRRYTTQQLEEWKNALKKASYLYGFEVNERQK
uniref:ADP-ribosyl cyclase/cyclic ADP-ribose hydrolase n=1 Tax=Wollemia nobilis TaxID=56998 RepID=A0A0C9QR81_9CONI